MKTPGPLTRRHFISSSSIPLAAAAFSRTAVAKSSYSETVLKQHLVGYWLSVGNHLVAAAFSRTAVAKSSYAETVLKQHPVGYWRLGEKHGPAAADAGGHDHPG